jgi:GNAT superfamily N-acetyltransferase
MSATITTTRTTELPLHVAEEIRDRLTKQGSPTNEDFHVIVGGMLGRIPADNMPDYPMSICLRMDPYTDAIHCLGWASATLWDSSLALQAFVDAEYRGQGLATALASVLVVDGILTRQMPIAVFSDECVRIAQRLRFPDIRRYRRVDDGWVRSERLFDNDEPDAPTGLGQE